MKLYNTQIKQIAMRNISEDKSSPVLKPSLMSGSQSFYGSGSQLQPSSMAVSFKSLNSILYKNSKEVANHEKILQLFTNYIDPAVQKLYNKLTTEAEGRILKGTAQDTIFFKEKTVLRSLVDSIAFPIKDVPFLILDTLLNLGKKVSFLKDSSEKLYESPFLSKIRAKAATEENLNKLQGFFENVNKSLVDSIPKEIKEKANPKELNELIGKKLDELINSSDIDAEMQFNLFKTASNQFSSKSGNYNTVHERVLNRLVTGLIPAIFLANDAYNLSVLCKDDKATSEKEKKTRFKQEVVRVCTNAYLQLITLGSLTNLVNASAANSALITSFTVLTSEITSRLSNGRAPYFISAEKAKEMNKKTAEKEAKSGKNKSNKNDSVKVQNLAVSDESKPTAVNDKLNKKNTSLLNFGDNKQNTIENNINQKEKSTIFSFSSLKKAVVFLLGSGIALGYLRNSKHFNKFDAKGELASGVKKQMNHIFEVVKNKLYKPLVEKEFVMSEVDFENALTKLDVNHEKFSKIYRKISEAAVRQDGKIVIHSKVDTKAKPFVDIVVQPFKFIWSTLELPYRLFKLPVKSVLEAISKKLPQESQKAQNINNILSEFFASDKKKSDNFEMLFIQSIEKIAQKAKAVDAGKLKQGQFDDFIENSIGSSYNVKTQSNYKNTSLGMLTKLVSSAITSVFLISDNYNMVMLKTNGEDKKEAKQKAQERVVQRTSGIFYQTLFMQWFNSVFESLYHTSLSGMASVVTMNTFATEFFTRASIGMPIGAKSYEELNEIDIKNRTRKGPLGSYFRFMSKLTGKKPLEKKTRKNDVNPDKGSQKTGILGSINSLNKTTTTDLLKIYGSK